MTLTQRQQAQQRHHPEETLSPEMIDRLVLELVLEAIEAGETSREQIRARLNQARADLEDGVIDREGRLTWSH